MGQRNLIKPTHPNSKEEKKKPVVIGEVGRWLFIPLKPRPKTEERKVLVLQASKLWKEGKSVKEIAELLNISFGVARYIVNRTNSGNCLAMRDLELFPKRTKEECTAKDETGNVD